MQSLALALGIALMAIKFLAWWLTNSNAILTDAMESIINVVAAAFGLYSLILAAKPRDSNHPYGHGKVEFISAGFEGALIFLAGIAIWMKAGYNIVYPQPLFQLDVGLGITAIAGAINYGAGFLLEKRGEHTNSLIMEASGKHLKSDAYSSAGLIIGLGLVILTGIPLLDNLLALLFGGVIMFTGFRLVRRSVAGIMDEADYQLIDEMVDTLHRNRRDSWIDVHNFRVIKYGPTLHIDCHMTVPWYFDTRQSHGEVKNVESLLGAHSTVPVEFFIHVDPCDPPRNCRICQMKNCPERQAPSELRVEWTLENIMKNAQHEV
ncbi:MAG: cation transporter [Phaeodactylibacter sp.]|nr:cation transporter [Phaeodactylibacter sp.]MCB9290402.1 cation transporter [Lewinellaceae bacterium]